MKKFITIMLALLFNCVVGAFAGGAVGISPVAGALGANVISGMAGLITSPASMSGILRAGVLTEVWTGELVKALRAGLEASWLDGIPDASSIAENDVIHLVDVGVDPDVLVNNTTYPIAIQELPDGDIAISLDKFQTKVTPITDDELYALSYDKMARVKESHANSIKDAKFAKAAHAIASATNFVVTTGSADPNTGRKKLTIADLISLKAKFDKMKIPAVGRRLVLTADHVNDLLGISESFTRQYNLDNVNGRVARLFGFDIYEFANCPVYTSAGVKQALGTAESGNKFQASFAFYTQRVFKATGSTKMYFSEAKNDPQNQRNLINFRHYFIAMMKKADASVALVNGYESGAAPVITGDELIDGLSAEAGTTKRTYNTSNGAAIQAQSNADWLGVTVASGNKVTFTRQAFAYDAEGTSPRVATVTLTIPNTSASLTVQVKQNMAANA